MWSKSKKKKNRNMSSRKTKILIVGSVVGLALLTISGVFIWKGNNSPKILPEKTNNSQKDLANKIKTDLKERIERVKNGSRSLEDMVPYLIQGKSALCNVEGLNFIKDGEQISADDIGEENFQSIVNLFKQLRATKKEWEEKKWREAREKADTNPNLFYFPGWGSFVGGILTDEITHFQFYSRQDKKDYRLTIPKLHPDLAGLSIKSDDWNLYHITGVENIPLVPCPIESIKVPYKIVKLEDKITIKLIEN